MIGPYGSFWIATTACLLVLLCGCGSSEPVPQRASEPGTLPRDALPGGLYHDFLDGKFDGAGHPLNADVWEAEGSSCSARTGWREREGLGLWTGWDEADAVCSASSPTLGRGQFTLNVRALVYETCAGEACGEDENVLTLVVRDAAGDPIASRTILHSAFLAANTYQNAHLEFTHRADEAVSFEVLWSGLIGARVDYVELFRSHRNLLLAPPSGVLEGDGDLRIELQDPPSDYRLELYCDDHDLTARLDELIAGGQGTAVETEFRSIVSAPIAMLLEGCPLPTQLRARVMSGTWARATSRITMLDGPPPCTFAPATTRVLLTGFEPFPAESTRDNSSEQAVRRFDPSAIEGISVMRLVLPVEFDSAATLLADAITRCQPDVVVGFGQGRSEVDLESTAYNVKESSAIAGGVPDNRGVIGEGDSIEAGGPAELQSGLPLEGIRAELDGAGIAVNLSDDPGRYVCNNLFYAIMTATGATTMAGGFIHLPRIAQVSDADRAMLQQVVQSVVSQSVQAR